MCFPFAHLWQVLEAPALGGGRNKAEVEWLLEKLEKLAIRRGDCNEKMSLNKANTILQRVFFLRSRRKQAVTSCLGFSAFLWQSQLRKSRRKLSPLSLDRVPGIQERKGRLQWGEQGSRTRCSCGHPLCSGPRPLHTDPASQHGLGLAAVTTGSQSLHTTQLSNSINLGFLMSQHSFHTQPTLLEHRLC